MARLDTKIDARISSDINNQIEVISRDLGIKKSELIRQLIHIGMENISGNKLLSYGDFKDNLFDRG